MMSDAEKLADVLHAVLESPNEADRNGEDANVVDGLFAIARAIDGLTSEIERWRLGRLVP